MKLTHLSTYVVDAYRTNWVFVRIEEEGGAYGWGEATLEYREHAVEAAIHALEPGLRTWDLRDIQGWWHHSYRDAYWRGGPVLTSALSAVEMALWDLKGKDLGVPVHQLFGGRVRSQVKCYANAWFAGASTADEFAEAARGAVEAGYGAIKWDPFGAAYRELDKGQLGRAMQIVEAVAEAVGDRAEIIIEGHGRFDLPAAQRAARALESVDVLWFEEPLMPGNLAAYALLREQTTVPLSLGERLYTRWDFREVLRDLSVDVLQPDVSHAGGLWETRLIGGMAELSQLSFAPHNPSGPVANAATLQLAACTPNFTYLETMATDVPWRSEIAVESSVIRDGLAHISDAPGLGVDINVEALAAHPYVRHDLRHYSGELTHIRPTDYVVRHRGES